MDVDEGDMEEEGEGGASAAAADPAATAAVGSSSTVDASDERRKEAITSAERAARMIDAIREYDAGDAGAASTTTTTTTTTAATISADVASSQPPPPPPAVSNAVATPTTAPATAPAVAAPPKRVITYSLYGSTPKYVLGAVRNAELIGQVFPGWTARFYIDLGTVPTAVVTNLTRLGAELVPIDMAKHGTQSMFWRFWAAADPTVERFISRDVDSRLMARDAAAVDLWIRSGRGFHVVRDHPSHSNYPMSGGLWGAKRGALPQVMELIAQFPTDSKYLTDMIFLNKLVWPIAMKDVLQHDAFTCVEFDGADAFPVAVDAAGHHVGQVFDAEGHGRENDVHALLDAPQPSACKPGGDPEAVRRTQGRQSSPPREQECQQMQKTFGVHVGKTWGSLPERLQLRWQRIACDPLFE